MRGSRISGGTPGSTVQTAAADRITQALGTPNVPGEPPVVSTFAGRRLIACGLLVDLSASPESVLVNSG